MVSCLAECEFLPDSAADGGAFSPLAMSARCRQLQRWSAPSGGWRELPTARINVTWVDARGILTPMTHGDRTHTLKRLGVR